MAVVPSLLVWLVLSSAVQPTAGEGSGYVPTGSLDELTDLGLMARLRGPGIRPFVTGPRRTSSGGEPKPVKPGESLIAAIAGPGIVQRIALIGPKRPPRNFNRAGIRLKAYLDRREEPALVLAIEDLIAGRNPRFPKPLVVETDDGLISHVPIVFRDGCRLTLDGKHSWLYQAQVSGIMLPAATGISSFQEELSPEDRVRIEEAVAIWSKPEDLTAPDRLATEKSEFAVDGIARNSHRFLMPAGPRTIRSLEIEPAPGTDDAWHAARMRLLWENDEGAAGVDVPLGFAFGRLPGVPPCQTLLVGTNGPAWANRFPMPYRRQAFLQIDSERAIRGTIRVRTVVGVAPDAAYLRAVFREGVALGVPKVSDPPIALDLELSGRGHYAGAMIEGRFPAQGAGGIGSARLVIPGVGTEVVVNGGPAQLARWDACPAQGRFLGLADSGFQQTAAYRWHAADPIPFVRPIRATIEPHDDAHRPTTKVSVALAVFWYTERPGPDPAGL